MMKRRTYIIVTLVALLFVTTYAAIKLATQVPVRDFLAYADTFPKSGQYAFEGSDQHKPADEVAESAMPWRLRPILAIERLFADRDLYTNWALEMNYRSEAVGSSYRVYVHVRGGDVWLVDILGDKAANAEMKALQRHLTKKYPFLTVRTRTKALTDGA